MNPAGGMPAARLEYLQKLRDVKFNEALYELLLKQYETAKLGEGSEPAVVQVIDRAIPPELKFKPKRTVMVLLAGVLGFFVSVLGAFVLEAVSRMKADPEEAAKLEELRSDIAAVSIPDAGDLVLTVSMGCALNPGTDTDYQELYQQADACLYRAKKSGKSRYEIERAHTDRPPAEQ